MGLSGGVDSSVAAALIDRAIGDRLCAFSSITDFCAPASANGWSGTFAGELGIALNVADASDLFLNRLAGVLDPEQKRRIIGHTFIEVFDTEAGRSVARTFSARVRFIPT